MAKELWKGICIVPSKKKKIYCRLLHNIFCTWEKSSSIKKTNPKPKEKTEKKMFTFATIQVVISELPFRLSQCFKKSSWPFKQKVLSRHICKQELHPFPCLWGFPLKGNFTSPDLCSNSTETEQITLHEPSVMCKYQDLQNLINYITCYLISLPMTMKFCKPCRV